MFRLQRSLTLFVICGLLALFAANYLPAAEAEFVGVLALVVEEDVARQLELSDDVLAKLKKLILDREDAVADLVLQLQKLPPAERADKLQPFVAESEKLGLTHLTAAQKTKLQKIQLSKRGLSAVTDEKIAEKLELKESQLESLQQLQTKMQTELKGATEREQYLIRANYERQMLALLNKTQRGTWEALTGLAEAAEPPQVAEKPPVAPAVDPKGKPLVPVEEPWFPEKEKGTDPKRNPPRTEIAGVKPDPRAEASVTSDKDKRLRFNFRYAPWKDVLEWFAQQADFSLVMDAPPHGTFNYTDSRSYSTAEAIDLLNGVLLTKGYTIIRRGRMILIHNLEEEINPNSVAQIVPDDLEGKGEYELVCCLFTLNKMTPEDAELEIRKLLGPQGKLIVLKTSRQVYVTETAGKLRLIQRVIQAVENPVIPKDEKVVVVPLKFTTPTAFLTLARPLLGIPENTNATPDGSLRMSIDEIGGRVLVTGKPERLERVMEIVKLIDLEESKAEVLGPIETPQLEVYTIPSADPAGTLQVMQTLLGGQTDVRLAIDSKTGNLVALARPSQHATIRATLDQLQRDGRQVEVIRLKKIDPQAAVLAINKLFGIEDGKDNASAPKIDSDPTTMQLLIRGSQAQIENIRELLKKMGESGESAVVEKVERSNVRFLPSAGRSTDAALDQAEFLWPTTGRENRIRISTPSKSPRTNSDIPQRRSPTTESKDSPAIDKERSEPIRERDARSFSRTRAVFVSQLGQPPVAARKEEPVPAEAEQPTPKPEKKSRPGADIVITQGPGGLIITSDDLDALDEFEALYNKLVETTAKSGREFTIFYLKFAKADTTADLLKEAIGVGGGDEGGGGSVLGDLASNVLGDSGGLLGGLLGIGGGGGKSSGAGSATTGVTIIPDMRLNALFVHASSKELDTMEQLLKVIDQPSSPEDVQTVARPRLIKLENTQAEDIAAVIRQVYVGRLAADNTQQRQPSPQELIQALRGGGRGGAQAQQKKAEEQKVTIGVDLRTNALVVSAPEYLFMEIKELVERLDSPVSKADESVAVVTLKRANPTTVQRTITAVLGDQVKTTIPTGTTPTAGARPQQQPGAATRGTTGGRGTGRTGGAVSNQGGNPQQQLQQQLELFQQLQRGAQGGGGFPGGGGFQGGGRGGR